MNRTILRVAMSAAVLGALDVGGAAAAEGVPSREASAAARQALRLEIQQARRASSAPFERLQGLKPHVVRLDAMKRGPLSPLAPVFKAMGPSGLLPMLEQLMQQCGATGYIQKTHDAQALLRQVKMYMQNA